ncbi:MAG: glycosyltransferase [Cytophagales bacterium]|nr:glycosyltransferase [Cytophaga sp.]
MYTTFILEFFFWVSVLLVLHSYVVFPKLIEFLARNKKQNQITWALTDHELPHVDILLAVYNEEHVIEKKILSVIETSYPLDRIHFYIGSDASTDKTNEIIRGYQRTYPNIILKEFSRTGKSGIVNELFHLSHSPVLVLTDANVFFETDTIYHLIKHYKNSNIGLTGGNILNPEVKNTGISFQEKKYLERENLIKYYEGTAYGSMIGAFGGCFSIRRNLYVNVPKNFIVDDFFLTMQVLRKDQQSINELSAVCSEDVSNKISEEFRRKVRISAGNFQNLFYFKDLLSPFKKGTAFCYVSHKVIRWITPFLLIFILLLNLLLLDVSYVYKLALAGQGILGISLLTDGLLKNIGIHLKIFRFITHFYTMNVALLVGFIKFSMGIKANVWTPTERNQ